MNKFLIVFLLLLSPLSYADSLYLGGWSRHMWEDAGVNNEVHYLVGYEHETLFVGAYKNSYSDWTTVVAKRLEFMESPNWKASINVGVIHGYKTCLKVKSDSKTTCIAVIPELTYTKYKIQPTLVLIGGAVGLTFKVEF